MSKSLTKDVMEKSLLAIAAAFLFMFAMLLGLTAFAAMSAMGGFILFLAWNQCVHSFFYGPAITFPQAWGLSVMVGLVTGNLKNLFERLVQATKKAWNSDTVK